MQKLTTFLRSQVPAGNLMLGSLGTLILNSISTILTFGLHAFLANILGVQGYSIYSYCFTLLTILTLLSVVGMDIGSQRLIANYASLSDWPLLRGFFIRSIQLVLSVSVVTAMSLAIFVYYYWDSVGDDLSEALIITALILPVSALLLLFVSILRGLKRPIFASIPRMVMRPLLLICAVAYVHFVMSTNIRGVDAMLLELLVTLIALFASAWYVKKFFPKEAVNAQTSVAVKVWVSAVSPLFFIAGIQIFVRSSDILFVGYFLGTDSVGPYTAASRIAQLAAFGLMAVNGVLPALISSHYAKKDMKTVQLLASVAAGTTFIFSFATTTVIWLFAEQILGVFGSEFIVAKWSLVILAMGQILNAGTGSVSFVLAMTGHQFWLLRVYMVAIIVNLVACLLLIPQFGIEGAAVSTALTTSLTNIVLVAICQRQLAIDPSIIGLVRLWWKI